MSNVYIKTKVRSGKEAMKYLGKYKNKTVLIVCDKFMAENGSVKTVINAIDSSCRIEMFDQAVPDPPQKWWETGWIRAQRYSRM